MEGTLKPLFGWRSAITESGLPPMTRLVALCLSMHMSERGENAFPSLETLAYESGLSKTSVIRHVRRLEEAGYLSVQHGGGRGRPSRYSAAVPASVLELQTETVPETVQETVRPDGLFDAEEGSETVHLGSEKGTPGWTGGRNTGGRKTKNKNKYSSEVNELCSAMSVRLAEMGVRKSRTEVTAQWQLDADGLLRVDGISLDDAVSVMNWATKDRFWSKNVLSPGALRRHWDRLRMECKPQASRDENYWQRLAEQMRAEKAARAVRGEHV